MSIEISEKLKMIRDAEGLSQSKFARLTGISLGMIKQYETGIRGAGVETLLKITTCESLKKYTLWLMSDETNEVAGQISPALSPDGQDNTSSHRSAKKAG
ncbi:TPA: helix-turn-helix transcriptional regulator [Klebsiella pneumoniae]|nr:helix-turn-helix transcriptional regulator [Klebsiella pneumoniae]HBZ7973511.1 helix-turn-helix transcriptional regulator [Klebsiella pneumoniae]